MGSPPCPGTSSPLHFFVPSVLLGSFPIYCSLEERVWLTKFLAELCLHFKVLRNQTSSAPVTWAGFCWFCSFLSQNPKLTARFFQMRLWGSLGRLLLASSCSRERARLGNVLNSWKPPLFSSENRENRVFISYCFSSLKVAK